MHQEYGVGTRATKNYQLLRQDMNLLANTTKNILNRIKNEYKEYPYLIKKINERKNKPKQPISIDCN